MVALSFNSHEEAATHLAKTATAVWNEAALVKQADVAQIMALLKKYPLLAGSLIGAGGGALYGAATSLGRKDEERNTLQSMLTGAMGGGLLGLGGGALYRFGKPLVNRYLRGLPPEGEGPDPHPEYTAKIIQGDKDRAAAAEKLRLAGKGPVGVDLEGVPLAKAIYLGHEDRAKLRPDQITALDVWANSTRGEWFMDRWEAENPELKPDSWAQSWLSRSVGSTPDSDRKLDLPPGTPAIRGKTFRLFESGDKNLVIQQKNQRGDAGPTATGGAITGAGIGGAMALSGNKTTAKDLQRAIKDDRKSWPRAKKLTGDSALAGKALTAAKKTRPGSLPFLGRFDPSRAWHAGVGDVKIPGVKKMPANSLLTAAKHGRGMRVGLGSIKARGWAPLALGTAGGFINSWRRNRLRSGN